MRRHYQKHDWRNHNRPQQHQKTRVKTSTIIIVWLIILALFSAAVFGIYKGVNTLVTHKDSIIAGISPMANNTLQTLKGYKDNIGEYKDDLITKFNNAWQEWQAERVATQKATEEAQQARKAEESLEKAESEKRRIEELEHSVVDQVNAIRTQRGSSPLIWDNELYIYSKQHSEDMANQRRLFHTSMYEPYAENAWGGEGSTSWTANTIVESWMSSQKHRTWLLCPHLKHIAVGIATSDNGMYASWTFWRGETWDADWWYVDDTSPPDWWY